MRISVVQQKIHGDYNPLTQSPPLEVLKEKAAQTLDETFAMLDEAGRRGSDLAVTIEAVNGHLHCADTRWPFTQVYEGLDGPTVQRFAQKAKEWKMHIVAGLYLVLDGKAHNCAVLFDDGGEIIGIHRKVHLPAGEELQERLDQNHITLNKNAIPGDPEKPSITSGVRIGTAAVTTRGLGTEEMKVIAHCIGETARDFEGTTEKVKATVAEICKQFPLYE